MSGPTTVIVTGEPVTAILAAAAIRAAQAIAEGREAARQWQTGQQEHHDAERAAQHAARAAGAAALAANRRAAESRLDRLEAAARAQGLDLAVPRPALPEDTPPEALATYIAALHQLADLLGARLAEAAPAGHLEAALSADLCSPELAKQQQLIAPPPAQPPAYLAEVQRLLARILPLGPLPPAVSALIAELAQPLPDERKESLLLELRHQIQLRQAAAFQEAQGIILEQSLKDLGYQVESVSDTLFVDGGVVHFRRPGWGDHLIRLRVSAGGGQANFNVLRATDDGNNERSVLDHLAEDRWCAEFPALLKALAARGVHLTVTRRLEAGELPVQLVDRQRLPRFADDEAHQPAARLQAKELP